MACEDGCMAKRFLTKEGKYYLMWAAVGGLIALFVIRFGHPHFVDSRTPETRKEMCEHDPPPVFPYHRMGWCK